MTLPLGRAGNNANSFDPFGDQDGLAEVEWLGEAATLPAPVSPAPNPGPDVNTPLPASGPGFAAYQSSQNRRYGKPETVAAFQAIGAQWLRAHPSGPRVQIGDMSLRGGGPMPPHKSHQTGLDADIRPMRRDGREAPVRYQAAAYSRPLTQELVDTIRGNGVAQVAFVFFNDHQVRGVRPWPGHDNHLHVRFVAVAPTATEPGIAGRIAAGARSVTDTLARAGTAAVVGAAILRGERDEGKLTNLLFFARHPELKGRKIQPQERALAQEWLRIRDEVVRPLLRLVGTPTRPVPSSGGASPGPSSGPLGTLTVDAARYGLDPKSNVQYQFTDDDRLWLARLIIGEAGGQDDGDNRAVIWALFNRFALFWLRVFPRDSFTGFIRKYSTVLQPSLRSPGAALRVIAANKRDPLKYPIKFTGGYYPPPYAQVPRVQYAKFVERQQLPWESLSAETRSLVDRALRGEIPNPGIGVASEFASTRVYFKQSHQNREPTPAEWRAYTEAYARDRCHRDHKGCTWIGDRPNLNQLKNAFFIDNRAKSIPAEAIQVVKPRS